MEEESVVRIEEIHPALRILERIDVRMQRRLSSSSGVPREAKLPPITRTAPMRIERRKKKLLDYILPKKADRFDNAPQRYDFEAAVTIERKERFTRGILSNISETGLFVACGTPVFREFEKVMLTIKPAGTKKRYRAIGTVVRYEEEGRVGYGIEFSY